MSNRKKQRRFEADMPKINRPLAFPELARGRTYVQPFNIKVEPLRHRSANFHRAQMTLLGLGVFAVISTVLSVLRVTAFLSNLP
jgi:hypothetical protein